MKMWRVIFLCAVLMNKTVAVFIVGYYDMNAQMNKINAF